MNETVIDGAVVADVGGSNARFGRFDRQRGAITDVQTLPVSGHASLAAALGRYLADMQQRQGKAYAPPQAAAIAVATAIVGDRVELTNSPWSFSQRALQSSLGLRRLEVINDFEALALALPRLKPGQLRQVVPIAQPVTDSRSHQAAQQATPETTRQATQPMAVLGPGTGLGVATAVPTAAGWLALAGEGGHATLAAGNDDEAALLRCVRQRHEHVSAERLLSGIGLPVLHAAVCECAGAAGEPRLEAPAIVEAAMAGEALAVRTMQTFCALLGSFAGNLALTVGARGGVFIGGGIVPRLGGFFDRSSFRERFEGKGRLSSYLRAIPTAVITDTLVALDGAVARLESPLAHSPTKP